MHEWMDGRLVGWVEIEYHLRARVAGVGIVRGTNVAELICSAVFFLRVRDTFSAIHSLIIIVIITTLISYILVELSLDLILKWKVGCTSNLKRSNDKYQVYVSTTLSIDVHQGMCVVVL